MYIMSKQKQKNKGDHKVIALKDKERNKELVNLPVSVLVSNPKNQKPDPDSDVIDWTP